MKKKNIVAVVVTYNRKKLLIECLDSILNQTCKVNKIVLIDNNSTDKTKEFLTEKGFLDDSVLYYKKLEKNIGGAGGFYHGMKESQKFNPDFVWIMDDDTIPSVNCLENLLLSLDKIEDKKVSFLASSVYGENGEFMNVPTINTEPLKNGYPDWYRYLSDGIVKIREATFVSLLINNDAIKSVGYPVKDYFIWGDDTEYTLRLNKYYGCSYMIGNSTVVHKRKATKSLNIIDEDSLNRINFHYYMIRNNLVNQRTYKGRLKCFIFLAKNQILSFKLFFSKTCKYKLKKFLIIHKAILSFVFGKYDKKAFDNRLDVNVIYKDN